MPELSEALRSFIEQESVGVLGTTRADGSVRQSVVFHVLDDDRVLISTESKRARGSARLPSPHDGAWFPGPVRQAAACGSGERSERDQRGWISGTSPEKPLTDDDLVSVDRVILELTIERVYGASHLEEA